MCNWCSSTVETFVCPWAWLRDHRIAWSHPGPQPVTEFSSMSSLSRQPWKRPEELWRLTNWLTYMMSMWDFANPDDAATCPNESNTTCRVIPHGHTSWFSLKLKTHEFNVSALLAWSVQGVPASFIDTALHDGPNRVFLFAACSAISLSHSFFPSRLDLWGFLCDPDIAQLSPACWWSWEKRLLATGPSTKSWCRKEETPEGNSLVVSWLLSPLIETYIGFLKRAFIEKNVNFCQAQISVSSGLMDMKAGYLSSEKAVDEKIFRPSPAKHLLAPKALAAAYLGEDRHRLHRLPRSHQGCCLF